MNPERRLAAHFTAANGFAFAAAALLGYCCEPAAMPGLLWSVISALALFGTLGLIQAAALRIAGRQLSLVGYTACSILAGVAVYGFVYQPGGEPDVVQAFGFGAFTGTALGLLQLWPLRRCLRRFWPWPILSGLAWGSVLLVQTAFPLLLDKMEVEGDSGALTAGGWALASLVGGGISGVAAITLTTPGETDEPT